MTVADMVQHEGYIYMTYANRPTGWLELSHFPNGATLQRVKDEVLLQAMGCSRAAIYDRGTNLANEKMAGFQEKWRATVRLSSPYYPQSNGRAEVAVKTVKRIIRDTAGVGGTLTLTEQPSPYFCISTHR